MSARRVLAVAILLATGLGYSAAAPAGEPDTSVKQPQAALWRPHAITVSKQTTYVEGPLDKDGRIDYLAAVNLHYRQRVAAERNAAVLIYPILGPDVVPEQHREAFFRQLGIACPQPNIATFVSLTDFAKRRTPTAKPPGSETSGAQGGSESAGRPPYAGGDSAPASVLNSRTLEGRIWTLCQRPMAAADQPLLAEWVEAQRLPLDAVAAASRRPCFWVPVVIDSAQPLYDAPCPAYGIDSVVEMHSALLARGMLRLAQSETQEAWSDVIAAYRLARLLSWSHDRLDLLRACRMENQSVQAVATLAHHARLTSRQAARLAVELRTLPSAQRLSETVAVFERFVFLDMLLRLATTGSIGIQRQSAPMQELLSAYCVLAREGKIDFDEAMRIANEHFDRKVRCLAERKREDFLAANTECEEVLQANTRDLRGATAGLMSLLLAPDPKKAAGRQIAWKLLLLTDHPVAATRHAEEGARLRHAMAQVALALAGYRADHGRYPDDLPSLCPKYLAEVPVDWYSGAALRYRREGGAYLLYSVGMDGRDDHGDEGSGAEGDLVVSPVVRSR